MAVGVKVVGGEQQRQLSNMTVAGRAINDHASEITNMSGYHHGIIVSTLLLSLAATAHKAARLDVEAAAICF